MRVNLPDGDSLDSRTVVGVGYYLSSAPFSAAAPHRISIERTNGTTKMFGCATLAESQMWRAMLNAAWQRAVTL